MCHENEEWSKNWRGINFSVQNWHDQFEEFWPEHSKISNIFTLMGCLWPNYIMFELKKYRGVMFDGTEYWCKIWRKTDLCFQKWHEIFGKFSPEHLKGSEVGLWWDSFKSKVENVYMSLKFIWELFVMTMKKDAKLEEELTCRFKSEMRTLINFNPSTWKSPKFAF